MKKTLVVLGAFIAAILFAATVTGPALADDPAPESAADAPIVVPRDRPGGYYIWHNEDGWHLYAHGPGERHHFTARIHTNGTIVDLSGVRLEDVDSYAVEDGGSTLLLDFHTYNGWDGVTFKLSDASCLRFRLELNGELIGPRRIYLGEAGMWHPDHNPFGMCRRG